MRQKKKKELFLNFLHCERFKLSIRRHCTSIVTGDIGLTSSSFHNHRQVSYYAAESFHIYCSV